MPYHLLIYISWATLETKTQELYEIANSAKINNSLNEITGILLYDNTLFIQILEGKKQNILSLLNTIQKDNRHHKLKILYESSLMQRNFPRWSMEVKKVPNKLYGITKQLSSFAKHKETFLPTLTTLLCNVFSQNTTSAFNHKINTKLTSREKLILHASIHNYSSQQIAIQLDISPKTVNRHLENIKEKIECHSKNELIQKIFQSGAIHDFLHCPF